MPVPRISIPRPLLSCPRASQSVTPEPVSTSAFAGQFALPLVLFAALAGCGTPGVPLPPSLHLPKPVNDLHAVRVGDRVYLDWSVPTETTDQQAIRSLGVTRVCRDFHPPTPAQADCAGVVADIAPTRSPTAPSTSEAIDHISKLVNGPQDSATYTVEVFNSAGRNAGPSNAATVFLAPSVMPPSSLSAQTQKGGVLLSWTNPPNPPAPHATTLLKARFLYRILRLASGASQPVTLADLPLAEAHSTFLDPTAESNKQYDYRIVGITRVLSPDGRLLDEFLGDPSPLVHVDVRDIFPPAQPTGLQAVSSGTSAETFIDLIWDANSEPDLAGYNVFRSEAGSPPVKLNQQPVKTPAYRDTSVKRGHLYSYTVTAIDENRNQSQPSQAATEKVPQ